MRGHDLGADTVANYRAFGREAHGRSAAYEALAYAVAADQPLLHFLSTLPRAKRQPNLLFAAAYYLLGEPPQIGTLRGLVRRDAARLTQVMLARRTQTNEPARCATLLPVLAALPGPLALIEVGASAGLTLLVDRYSYDYGGHRVEGLDPAAPVLRCTVSGPAPLPTAVPTVAWRAGLDLNPLDVTSDDDVHWLSCLIWPGEGDRRQRLAAAVATARRDPPAIHRGDLLTDLPALAARAPADATLVVYHSAVLAYVSPPGRREFAAIVGGLDAVWLSNEAPGVVESVPRTSAPDAAFVLARDGRTALALTGGHGDWLCWIAP